MYSSFIFELSYVVILMSSITISNGKLHPDFLNKCFRVVFLSHFYSYATSGKNVAENLRPFLLSSKIIPFLPIYQSYAPKLGTKLTKNDNPTFRVGNSVKSTGSKRSSSREEISAYSPSIFDSLSGENVPMHPLS